MPDPTGKTISATQSPALFNASPYFTRWMLHQHFAKAIPLDPDEPNGRMLWGKKLQPLIIAQTAEDLRFEVRPNTADRYHRRGQLGCTRDAEIICPDRGPGALETKCVFDYRTWMADWNGGRGAPRHIEVQNQQQMLVGDGDGTPSYEWGVIAVWVAGDMHYFERKPIRALWQKLETEAADFFAAISAGDEPEPFGAPIEVPWLAELFPVERGKSIDLSDEVSLAEAAVQYRDAKEQEAAGARTAERLRSKLLAAAKDAEEVLLADGLKVRLRQHGKGKRITLYDPSVPLDLLAAG